MIERGGPQPATTAPARHNGTVATCLHGFESGQCLICRTLAPSADRDGPRSKHRVGAPPSTTGADRRPAATAPVFSAPVEVVDGRPRGRLTPARRTVAVLVTAVVAIAAVWLVAGAVFALLRLLEVFVVAAATGVIGYRLGRARGHRER